jgi:hypothetical protein
MALSQEVTMFRSTKRSGNPANAMPAVDAMREVEALVARIKAGPMFLSVSRVAEILNMDPETVTARVFEGKLVALKNVAPRRIVRESVIAYLRGLPIKNNDPQARNKKLRSAVQPN